MKRYLTLAILVLLAASCGGRRGHQADGDAADSLATDAPEAPKTSPRASRADSAAVSAARKLLPEEPYFDIVTNMGTIRVKLYKDTPKHRDNFSRLALSHFYDDVLFHRVINGFMLQGGDPYTRDTLRIDEWGEGGPGYTIDAEFVPEHRHIKGALAAARRGDLANPLKESSGSQFYLVQDSTNCRHLNGEYTVFGETVAGLNVIDRIASVPTDRYDHPIRPVQIIRIRPNDQMNKRALEEEQRAREEAGILDSATPDQMPAIEEVEPANEGKNPADSSATRGQKPKHRIERVNREKN